MTFAALLLELAFPAWKELSADENRSNVSELPVLLPPSFGVAVGGGVLLLVLVLVGLYCWAIKRRNNRRGWWRDQRKDGPGSPSTGAQLKKTGQVTPPV